MKPVIHVGIDVGSTTVKVVALSPYLKLLFGRYQRHMSDIRSATISLLKELQKDYSLYARFKAFRERRIYGCNTHRIPFYEESPFHPEILLKDMVKIFHPELLEGYEPKYFSNLAE